MTTATKTPTNFESWYKSTDAYKAQIKEHLTALDETYERLWAELAELQDTEPTEVAKLDDTVREAEAKMVEARTKLQAETAAWAEAKNARLHRANQIGDRKALIQRQIEKTLADITEAKGNLTNV